MKEPKSLTKVRGHWLAGPKVLGGKCHFADTWEAVHCFSSDLAVRSGEPAPNPLDQAGLPPGMQCRVLGLGNGPVQRSLSDPMGLYVLQEALPRGRHRISETRPIILPKYSNQRCTEKPIRRNKILSHCVQQQRKRAPFWHYWKALSRSYGSIPQEIQNLSCK